MIFFFVDVTIPGEDTKEFMDVLSELNTPDIIIIVVSSTTDPVRYP